MTRIISIIALSQLLATTAFALPRPTRLAPSNKTQAPKKEICVASGNFNVTADKKSLHMEKFCLSGSERRQVPDHVVGEFRPRIFVTPFTNAAISVTKDGGKTIVTLHYREEGKVHPVVLDPQEEGEYKYSFSHLVPHTVKRAKIE